MPEPRQPSLVRAIGRWSLAALTINCIIGSGVFGLPSVISGLVGSASPFAWLFAAIATALIMACFAEVSSRFDQSGGVYLYSRTAFGRTTGIAIAWLGWLGRLTAAAANASLFIIYLAEFWPAAKNPIPRVTLLTVLLGFLTVVNYVGVRRGAVLSNVLTVAKLTTLAGFIAVGACFLVLRHQPLLIKLPSGPSANWFHAILLLMFAYGGYEAALSAGGEATNPRRDYPLALFVSLLACTFLYTMTQWIVISVLPIGSMGERPLAAAASVMLGKWGANLVAFGILVSSYGLLGANILGFPRLLFAMAEQGDAPSVLARVHPRFRTPYVAIVLFVLLVYGFALSTTFQGNVMISAIARLLYYGSVCAALPVLRRKAGVPREQFHLPMGDLLAALAVGVSLLLFPKLDRIGLTIMAVVSAAIIANSLWAARRERAKQAKASPIQ